MLSYGTIQMALNDVVARDDIDEMELIKLRSESETLCETIEFGLMALGDMVSRLGYFADSKQDFDNRAMSNDNVKHIGALIQANAYFLNTLRNVSAGATYNLNGGDKGEK